MMIRELEVKELHKTAEWLYQMNEQDHHYVAWLASDPDEIFEQIWSLTQFEDPLAYVAWEGEEIIGFIGLLPFFEQKLCRLLGPFASKDEENVIERLWDKLSLTVQLYFDMAKVACFSSNHELIDFVKRHDFRLYNMEKTLEVMPETFIQQETPQPPITKLTEEWAQELDTIHPAGAYYTTGEMMGLAKEEGNELWGALENGSLVGYLYLETIKKGTEGELCFVNVKRGKRGKGIGSALIRHALHYAFDVLHLEVVTISVRTENQRAETLYRSFGFQELNTIYAYEKIMKHEPPLIH